MIGFDLKLKLKLISYIKSTDLNEFRNEMTADVERDEGFKTADACSADEDGGRAVTEGGSKMIVVVVGVRE